MPNYLRRQEPALRKQWSVVGGEWSILNLLHNTYDSQLTTNIVEAAPAASYLVGATPVA